MASSPGSRPRPPPRWAVAVAAVLVLLAALALWPRGGPPTGHFAASVEQFREGRIQKGGCPENDPKAALGPPDNRYVSLGIGGRLILDLSIPARDVRDLIIYEVTGPSLIVPSQPRTPLVQSSGNGTIAFIQITASPAWPLGGDEIAVIDFDPGSRTPDGFTRVVISDESQEPVKCVSGVDIDAVEVIPPPAR
ncbi:MAG: hypothetical protein QXT68_08110 [Halobacteria archaeon]